MVIKLRGVNPCPANVSAVENIGLWIEGGNFAPGIESHFADPVFFVPWGNVDWVAKKKE